MDVSLNRNPFQPLPTEEWSVPESPDAGVRNTHNGKLQKQSKGENLRLTGRNYRVIVSISDQDREGLYAYTTDNRNKQKPWHLSLIVAACCGMAITSIGIVTNCILYLTETSSNARKHSVFQKYA